MFTIFTDINIVTVVVRVFRGKRRMKLLVVLLVAMFVVLSAVMQAEAQSPLGNGNSMTSGGVADIADFWPLPIR